MRQHTETTGKRRTVRCFRVTEQEDREIRAEALRRGMSISDYLRSLVPEGPAEQQG